MDMTVGNMRKADTPGDDPRLEDPPHSGGAASSTAPADAEMAELIGSLEDDGMLRRVTLWLSASSAVDVSEAFNPGRFAEHCNRYALTPGHAFDMTLVDPDDGELWDMNVLSKRAKAKWLIEQEKPKLLIDVQGVQPAHG
eukprot:12889777-Heterocapsa_arctica.AAC.1